MKWFKPGRRTSFRNTALFSMSVIVFPLLIVVGLFDWYTVQEQITAVRESDRSALSIYRTQLEDTIKVAEDYLTDTIVNSTDFETIVFSKSKTETFLASLAMGKQTKILLKAYNVIGGFFTYSNPFDCYRITYTGSYPQKDLEVLRATVVAAAETNSLLSEWVPVKLSDRTVLLYTYSRFHCSLAVMIDPSRQYHSDLEKECRVFYTMSSGKPFAPSTAFGDIPIPNTKVDYSVLQDSDGRKYDLVSLPLDKVDANIIFASPAASFLSQLSLMQWVMLVITLCLLACIPLCWLTLRRLLLEPLNSLTNTMQAIQNGNTDIRTPQESRIEEVNEIAGTVNTMLDTICRQKIDSYEQLLATQHAQLQYLQLQIRPHFYLNCLSMIYSMAGEKKYDSIQELALDLSVYLRSVFKDSSKLIPLDSEIQSVESYIRIQQAGAQVPPRLEITADANTVKILIPPLSILTFVENSVKHSRLMDSPLEIRINCTLLHGEGESYLNVTVCDNGGGFTQEQLHAFNDSNDEIYTDTHVGITNIRHRLRLLYGGKADLCFLNASGGACVELFFPPEWEDLGGIPE